MLKNESPVIVGCTAINRNDQKCNRSDPVAGQGFDLMLTVEVLVVFNLF